MLFLRTEARLSKEEIEVMRNQIKEHAGEDCIILTCGMTVERIPVEKDKAASK